LFASILLTVITETAMMVSMFWKKDKTPWSESAREPCRPSDRRLSAELEPTFTDRGVSRGQCDRSLRSYSWFYRPEPLPFLSSSSSIVLTRLSGPRSRPTTSQKNLVAPGLEPRFLDL
jgi:hypothetical protein